MRMFLVAGSCWDRDPRCARPLPEPLVPVDPIVDVQDKLRGCARDPSTVRHVIERALKLGMLVHIAMDFLKTFARRLEALLEFRLGLDLGFTEGHLDAAVRVHFAFARSLDGQEDHVFEFVDYRGLHSV